VRRGERNSRTHSIQDTGVRTSSRSLHLTLRRRRNAEDADQPLHIPSRRTKHGGQSKPLEPIRQVLRPYPLPPLPQKEERRARRKARKAVRQAFPPLIHPSSPFNHSPSGCAFLARIVHEYDRCRLIHTLTFTFSHPTDYGAFVQASQLLVEEEEEDRIPGFEALGCTATVTRSQALDPHSPSTTTVSSHANAGKWTSS
jgi:hypothetical protein